MDIRLTNKISLKDKPLISIVTPNFKSPDLEKTIISVLKQEYENMRKYLGADDIKRLQLEKIRESNSVNSYDFCSN